MTKLQYEDNQLDYQLSCRSQLKKRKKKKEKESQKGTKKIQTRTILQSMFSILQGNRDDKFLPPPT